jgi:phage shock protein A
MQARASAVEELTAAGALTDLSGTSDDIDRQLQQISQSGQVDDELAKMKAELQSGGEPAKQLEGEPPASS